MAVATYTASGAKATTAAKLNKDIFDLDVQSHSLLKQAYVAHQANMRINLAKTLKRGEVRGGGRKPWKQKGTGRARFGSIRVPIWRGGGITFGPLGKENYSKKISTQSKRTALRQALSVNKDAIIVVDTPSFKDGKTAQAASFFKKIGASRNILFVVDKKLDETVRATSNIPHLQLASAQYLTVYDILNADTIVVTKEGLALIDAWLDKPAKTPKESK